MTSRAELDRQFWRRSAGSASANPAAWAHTADCLRRAADELRSIWQQDLANLPKLLGTFEPLPVSIAFVIPLLLGLALENLAKGLIVANDPTQAVDTDPSSTKLLPELRKRHLSTRLLEEAGVNLSSDERGQVDRLRTFLLWAGRYPVALDAMHMSYTQPGQAPASISSTDLTTIHGLLDRVHAQILSRAQRRASAEEADSQVERITQRPVVLAELDALEQLIEDGVIRYVDRSAPEEPGAMVACAACGQTFVISKRFPAAICGCGTLHRLQVFWDGSLGRWLVGFETWPS